MPGGVSIVVTPDDQAFLDEMLAMEGRVEIMGPLYELLHETFLASEESIFDKEGRGAAVGGGWHGLATSTAIIRGWLGIGEYHPILDRTGSSYGDREGGMLRASLTRAEAQNHVFEMGPDYVEFGTDDPVAEYHQYGEGKIPRRPLIAETQKSVNVYSRIIRDYVLGIAKRVSEYDEAMGI